MSAHRVFIDTNILVYPYDLKAGEKRIRARDLLRQTPRSRSFISTQVLQESFNTLTRKFKYDLPSAKSILQTLEKMNVFVVGVATINAAMDLCSTASLSWWDALIVAAAQATGCQKLWSEDLNAGQVIAGVEIVNPFAQQPQ